MKKIKKFIKEHKKDIMIGTGLTILGVMAYKMEVKKLQKEYVEELQDKIIDVDYEIVDCDD